MNDLDDLSEKDQEFITENFPSNSPLQFRYRRLAIEICTIFKDSRLRSLALTNLQNSILWLESISR